RPPCPAGRVVQLAPYVAFVTFSVALLGATGPSPPATPPSPGRPASSASRSPSSPPAEPPLIQPPRALGRSGAACGVPPLPGRVRGRHAAGAPRISPPRTAVSWR